DTKATKILVGLSGTGALARLVSGRSFSTKLSPNKSRILGVSEVQPPATRGGLRARTSLSRTPQPHSLRRDCHCHVGNDHYSRGHHAAHRPCPRPANACEPELYSARLHLQPSSLSLPHRVHRRVVPAQRGIARPAARFLVDPRHPRPARLLARLRFRTVVL